MQENIRLIELFDVFIVVIKQTIYCFLESAV